jgi:hypothetical protein
MDSAEDTQQPCGNEKNQQILAKLSELKDAAKYRIDE